MGVLYLQDKDDYFISPLPYFDEAEEEFEENLILQRDNNRIAYFHFE